MILARTGELALLTSIIPRINQLLTVCDTSPKQQKRAKGQSIGGHDPLESALGDVQVPADRRQDDDNGLA